MSATATVTQTDVSTPAQILRRAWSAFTAKRAANAADKSHRTVEGWLAGRGEPSLSDALRMAERDEAFRQELSRELAAINARIEGNKDAELSAGERVLRRVKDRGPR
jgi:hypothetical protein